MLPDHDLLYSVAESQTGYFTVRQAAAVGFSKSLVAYHARAGTFRRAAHGVYRLTRFPATRYEDLFVAWLRVGPNAVISHDSALAIYDLSDALPSEVHLIVSRKSSRRRSGMRLHTHRLLPDEVTTREGLPITTAARTIADVIEAAIATDLARQAISEALQRGLTTWEELRTQAGRRGVRMRHLLAELERAQAAE